MLVSLAGHRVSQDTFWGSWGKQSSLVGAVWFPYEMCLGAASVPILGWLHLLGMTSCGDCEFPVFPECQDTAGLGQ